MTREPPAKPSSPETDAAIEPDLTSLDALAERLRAAGRREEAEQLRAWRNLHALRARAAGDEAP